MTSLEKKNWNLGKNPGNLRKKRRDEEFRRQDIGQAAEEAKPETPGEGASNDDAWEDYELPTSEREQEEVTVEPEENLRPDLTVRNQPEPGRHLRNDKHPKHFR